MCGDNHILHIQKCAIFDEKRFPIGANACIIVAKTKYLILLGAWNIQCALVHWLQLRKVSKSGQVIG